MELPYNEKVLIHLWSNRNPVNENNSSTGECMFWKTVFMVMQDYIREVSSKQMTELQQLVQKRKELKLVEKKYFDFESPKEYLKAHKLRKQTEKEIFKILENECSI